MWTLLSLHRKLEGAENLSNETHAATVVQPLNDRRVSKIDVQVRCWNKWFLWLITYFLSFPLVQKILRCFAYKFLRWDDI